MAYTALRINKATQSIVTRIDRKRIDAAIFQAHSLLYAAAEAYGLRDRPVAYNALAAIHAFKGKGDVVVAIGDDEIHLYPN